MDVPQWIFCVYHWILGWRWDSMPAKQAFYLKTDDASFKGILRCLFWEIIFKNGSQTLDWLVCIGPQAFWGAYTWFCARKHYKRASEDYIECQKPDPGQLHARQVSFRYNISPVPRIFLAFLQNYVSTFKAHSRLCFQKQKHSLNKLFHKSYSCHFSAFKKGNKQTHQLYVMNHY